MNKLGVLLLMLALTACESLERRERVLGTFWDEESETVTLPSEATRGEPFEVQVRTVGDGCTEPGETEVEVRGLEVSITPFDYQTIPASNSACPAYAKELVHTTSLILEQSGTATITFYGQNSDYSSPERLMTIERTVTVR